MMIFDNTCICFRNAINADPNYYVAVGSHWLRKWVTARSLATRPGRRGVGVDRLASDLLLLKRAVQCPSFLLRGVWGPALMLGLAETGHVVTAETMDR